MISFKEKKFEPQKILPQVGRGEEFRNLPKYICYRAALLKEKMILSNMLLVILVLVSAYFVHSRMEIMDLYERLRKKEYILAPGVRDFTTVNPQTVPDDYVSDAVEDFAITFGTVNRHTIHRQYRALQRFMSPDLAVRFDIDTRKWVDQIKSDDIAQIIRPKQRKISLKKDGSYEVTVHGKSDLYSGGEYLGEEEQVIKMTLQLTPPNREKRWFLNIIDFSWEKADLRKFNGTVKSQKGK